MLHNIQIVYYYYYYYYYYYLQITTLISASFVSRVTSPGISGHESGSLEPCSNPGDVNKHAKQHGTLNANLVPLQPVYSRPL